MTRRWLLLATTIALTVGCSGARPTTSPGADLPESDPAVTQTAEPQPAPTVTKTATQTAEPQPAPTVTRTVTKTEVKTVTKTVTPQSCRTALREADKMRDFAAQLYDKHAQFSRLAIQTAEFAAAGDGGLGQDIGRLNQLDDEMIAIGERARVAVAKFRAARTSCLSH